MTTDQVQQVKVSCIFIVPISQQAGELFYGRLFEVAPSVRFLFKGDIQPQAKKLIAMITFVVNKLDNLGEIIGDVQSLAVRHNNYGAKPEHYAVVGDCLLWTLEKGLGDKWNDSLKEAWTLAYTTLSAAMIDAQANAAV